MDKKDKELLFREVSMRLTYGIFCDISKYHDFYYDSSSNSTVHLHQEKPVRITGIDISKDCIYLDNLGISYVSGYNEYGNMKLYLRLLSSMTDKEKKEFRKLYAETIDMDNVSSSAICAQFYYSHHIDVFDLIGKGLAVEAPEDMYKNI